MVKCNLNVILAQKNLKISQVSKATKISRTTLHALASNLGQGVQFDTLDKLCTFLNITPQELFIYVPIDIKFDLVFSGEFFKANFTLTEFSKKKDYIISGDYISSTDENGKLTYLEVALDNDIDSQAMEFFDRIRKLPQIFISSIEERLLLEVINRFPGMSSPKIYPLVWPDYFFK